MEAKTDEIDVSNYYTSDNGNKYLFLEGKWTAIKDEDEDFFNEKQGFEVRKEKETEEGFECSECGETFSSEKGMKIHKSQSHGGE